MTDQTSNTESKEMSAFTKSIVKGLSKLNAWVFKKSNGRFLNRVKGLEICVVTMKGAKSGKMLDFPLMYVPYKEGVLLVASFGGAPKHPVWYYNLVANPAIEVRAKGQLMHLQARRVSSEEKSALWSICCEHYPDYETYRHRTARDIPVFECLPEK